MIEIPVTVCAKNEERAIGACLDALIASAEHAEARGAFRFDLLVVLDDCIDATGAIARQRSRVRVRASTGGKVEAQRAGQRAGPFSIFVDADVLVTKETLLALAHSMTAGPQIMVAFPPKIPLPPTRGGRLARALYVYNRARGFSSQRTWFNGKCFAIRGWSIPTREELAERLGSLPRDRFYDFQAGVRVDDIYLSRRIAHDHGPQAFLETTEGAVVYRPPTTLRGMYRYYRRMRMDLERTSVIFPELEGAHQRFGRREPDRLRAAPIGERIAYAEFQLALALCRIAYRAERAYYQRCSSATCPHWPPIEETKCSLATPIPG